MEASATLGCVHSIQSLGTLDGPGVRFTAFMQGCPLRCACCHNPDTWEAEGGTLYTPKALFEKALHFREYFGDKGGVTLSGGEPLLQAPFATAFFKLCKEAGLNTCLDTSGCLLGGETDALLAVTDRVLLDIKYATNEAYRSLVGCALDAPLAFLSRLEERGVATTLRSVIIPSYNDTEEHLAFLASLVKAHSCVDAVELLPFRKLCTVKYEKLGLPFRFADVPAASAKEVGEMQARLIQML